MSQSVFPCDAVDEAGPARNERRALGPVHTHLWEDRAGDRLTASL